ncbi:hypothetical protein BDV93DRAFT_528641 [Ceratobasidium sp. AG-I]|nr:hypothetical protein BDV93DRAFT_528641 [Ceratobasidium sp. AG-I]
MTSPTRVMHQLGPHTNVSTLRFIFIMPNSAQIRKIPNHFLYDLKLEYDGPENETTLLPYTVVIRATLTAEARARGVRMDESREDDTFELSAELGTNNGQYSWGGSQLQRTAKNMHLVEEIQDKLKLRLLRADLSTNIIGDFNENMPFDLDKHIGLVDYLHPLKNETYFKLGLKPEPIKERSLVLCFDGTSNHFSHQNTNVVKLVELLKEDDPERQMVYYQTGVGTYTSPGWANSMGEGIAKTLDEGIAWYLDQHIMDGYRYLMETYRAGDRICIFGFSRGAFTARALAGMIHCVGLLPRHNIEHIPFAYQLYANSKEKDPKEKATSKPREVLGALETGNPDPRMLNPEDYKQTFCTPINIDFVGVWDTVASVGALIPKFLPWIDHNPSIRVFRHAVSLDEHRASFVPSLWNHSLTELQSQDVREVWFKGQHCDIGGGADEPKDKKTPEGATPNCSRLSNITLRWMVRQCIEADTIVVYEHQAMDKYRSPENPDMKVLESNSIREEIMRKEALQQKKLDKVALFLSQKAKTTLAEVALEQIKRDRKREKNYATEKRGEMPMITESSRGALFESALLDRRDIVHEPFDAVEKHPSWNVLEYIPLPRRVPNESGIDWPHRNQPRVVHFVERSDFPQFDKYSRKLRPIHRSSSNHPIRIHASVIDHLTTKSNGYIPQAIWHNLPAKVFPYVEDAVPADKLPKKDPPKGEDAGKPIGAWSKRAEDAINKDPKVAQEEVQKAAQPEAQGFFGRIVSKVWG